ncbi:YadA family autotransporter adhesin, partial [Glaesserella sp.]
ATSGAIEVLFADNPTFANITATGELSVAGNTTLAKDLTVSGNSTVNGDSTVKGNQTVEKGLTVSGDTALNGNTTVAKDLTVNGDSTVKGNQTVEKGLTVSGDTALNGNATVAKDLTVSGNTTLNQNLTVLGNQSVMGNSLINGTLTTRGMFYAGGGITVTSGQIVDMGGNRIQNVGDALNGNDAVNLAQLNKKVAEMQDKLVDLGMLYEGNSGTTTRQLGSTLVIAGDATTKGDYNSANVKTTVTEGKVEIQIAENPVFNNITANGDVEIKGNQHIEGNSSVRGNQTIEGDLTVNGTTNLKDTIITGNQTVTGNSTIGGNQAIEGNLTVNGTTNLKDTTISGNTTIGGNGSSFNIVGGTTIDMGGNVITNVGSGKVSSGSTDLVNGDQLYNAVNQLTDAGLNFSTNNGTLARKLGETATISGTLSNAEAASSKNIRTAVNTSGEIELLFSEKPNFDSVNTTNLNVTGNTTLSGKVNVAAGTAVNMGNNVIDGVADGDISPTSKQAVTGSQLYSLSNTLVGSNQVTVQKATLADGTVIDVPVVEANGKTYTLTTYNVQGQTEQVTNSVVTAVHNMNEQGIKFFHTNDGVATSVNEASNSIDSSAAGAYSTAVGYKAQAGGTNALAIGNGATASGEDSISIGTGNQVTGSHSAAIGDPSTVSGDGSYSIGNDNTVTTDDTYVLGSRVSQTLANSVFLGNDSGYVKAGETTRGNRAYVGHGFAGQTYYFAGGEEDQVAGVVSVGNVSADGKMQTRRIQNVAPGLLSAGSTDAINGSQLYSTINNFNLKFGDMNNRISTIDRDLRSGIAGAVAMGTLVQAYSPSDSLLAIGAGTYRGASALSLGYSKVSDNGRIILKVSGGVNNAGHYMGGASIGFKF